MLLKKYQNSWITDFENIKEILERNLPKKEINIEHIGSTSVINLAAKPIIDIDIIYNKPKSFEVIKLGLDKLGYYHNGNQGIEGREVFKRVDPNKTNSLLDSIKHHLYVCPINCKELQRHLSFRDYLRKNEQARIRYEKLKYEIAELANQDRKEYANLKATMAREFVDSVLEKSKNKLS